jgi:hypothetical protein
MGLLDTLRDHVLACQGIAAQGMGRAFGYDKGARWTVWALILPQVAATLGTALVAYDTRNATGERLLDNTMLNAVLVLMTLDND